jgi:hypothetical protein
MESESPIRARATSAKIRPSRGGGGRSRRQYGRRLLGTPSSPAILGTTPYALRRGGISLRVRTEDPQTVARECGTSLQMLNIHYAFALEDLRHQPPRPADVEWRAARVALLGGGVNKQASPAEAGHHAVPSHSKVRAWLSRRRRSDGS